MQIAALLSQQLENGTALEQAIELIQVLLNRLAAGTTDHSKAVLLCDLAYAMEQLPANHHLWKLYQMEAHYREALSFYLDSDRPIDAAFLQRSLGTVLYKQGRYQEALESFQAAIQSLQASEQYNNTVGLILSNYASALNNLGRIEEALVAYNESMRLLLDAAPLYRNRAEVLIHLLRFVEAEAELAQVMTLDGNEMSIYFLYHRAQIAIACGDGLLADRVLDEVLRRDALFDVTLQRAQAAWLQGGLESAQEVFQQVWEKANLGERAAIRREIERLFAEHFELAGQDALHGMMRKGDE